MVQFIRWLCLARSKYYDWSRRYGKANEHNGLVPRDFWLEPAEVAAILQFHAEHPLEGYRRLAFMMLDADVAAAAPATVYRVLHNAGVMRRHNGKPSLKGKGFHQPKRPHEHWHVDVSYLNVRGTFYYICTVLDGYSRAVVHWDVRERMKTRDVEVILQRAREKYPEARPRIISDNGPQFVAKEFKAFIRLCEMSHVKTSPFYPQSNGKVERWHKTLKSECIRPETPLSLEDAFRIVKRYVDHYNTVRLHGAIGYVTPADKLAGKEKAIWASRDRKLEAARTRRQQLRTKLLTRQEGSGEVQVRGETETGSAGGQLVEG